MGTYMRCLACGGTGRVSYGNSYFSHTCGGCKGTGSVELPVEEVIGWLKKLVIKYVQQHKVQKPTQQAIATKAMSEGIANIIREAAKNARRS